MYYNICIIYLYIKESVQKYSSVIILFSYSLMHTLWQPLLSALEIRWANAFWTWLRIPEKYL